MRRSVSFLAVILILILLFPCSFVSASEGDETPPAEAALSGEAAIAETAVTIVAIVLCVLFGIIVSFYIIHSMKNKH